MLQDHQLQTHLPSVVNTLGQYLLARYGRRVHKLAINAGFTCPNRDGSKGRGGCTFCNNVSFSPNARALPDIGEQIEAGRQVLKKRTGATAFLAYFQAYTNTYADVAELNLLYRQALQEPDVIGLSIGTRPDCVPQEVLELLVAYQDQGYEIWLELGLQSAFDDTLERVNRGHDFACYLDAVQKARAMGIKVCTHLILGLPGDTPERCLESLEMVLDAGVDGLKLHPLHVVKGTALANEWRRGEYQPLSFNEYIETAATLVAHTPPDVVFHRLTGTAARDILLAPSWCSQKWRVLNALTNTLLEQGQQQGSALGLAALGRRFQSTACEAYPRCN